MDPGSLGAEDHRANLRAVREGTRVFSAYELRGGTRIWIITEADRSVTTILLPEEYRSLIGFTRGLLATLLAKHMLVDAVAMRGLLSRCFNSFLTVWVWDSQNSG